jgi:FAD/FMN-containing dehydrogenase
MMDREIIRAVEASVFAAGLPPDAGAALLIELDGIEAGLDDEAQKVTSICMEYGARNCRYARDEAERKKLWAARKGAFGAIGRISPDSMIQDAVVPRSRLPEVLGAAYDIAARYQLRIANVFHAGDGNLHPLICFDSRSPEQVLRVKEAGRELMEVCVRAGGTITGEHGVGLDKRELLPLVFSDADMNAMLLVRAAFDPLGLCNPGKIVPMLRGCGEAKAVASDNGSATQAVHMPIVATPEIEVATPAPFDPDRARSFLGQIVGDANISSHNGAIIVTPASAEEISEILKIASSERWTIVPAGGMTWLQSTANLIVSTSRLNRIIEHEPADLIAVAQAGVRLTDFNAKLAENGQWLPLDPPDDGRATLGGVVATGIGGAQQFGYGRPRGSVIGMNVVLADGSMIKAGGRVVKNVAGYDLCKLFTGSYGSLGIITELNFKLRPRPAREATVIARGAIEELRQSARAILEARLFPVAAELSSDALFVRFAGNEKGVAFQTEQALKLLKNAEIVLDDAELWKNIAAARVSEGRIREAPSGTAKVLMERIKRQLDPKNILAAD